MTVVSFWLLSLSELQLPLNALPHMLKLIPLLFLGPAHMPAITPSHITVTSLLIINHPPPYAASFFSIALNTT